MNYKKIIASACSIALIAAMAVPVFAEDDDRVKTGSATLSLAGDEGLLYLVTAPSEIAQLPQTFHDLGSQSIHFGGGNVTGSKQTIDADDPVGLIVRDGRGKGVNSIWSVTAHLGSFTDDESGTESLAGAQITLDFNTEAVGLENNRAGTPSVLSISLVAGGSESPTLFHSATKENKGSAGVWGGSWDASIEIPPSAEAGAHTATLTWTLAAAPF